MLLLSTPTDRDLIIFDDCSSGLRLLGRACCLSLKARTKIFGFSSIVLSEDLREQESTVSPLSVVGLEGLSFFEVLLHVIGSPGCCFFLLLVATDVSRVCRFALMYISSWHFIVVPDS
uniref:STY2 n=1 Tax=Arundo donax TaxID=35708 RepID=A0A0A9DR47_ARUDO